MPVGNLSTIAQQRSFDDLGTPLAEVTFCVIDLETTGGNRTDDSITEIGAVKVRGGECLGTFQTLVNPGRAIPPQITVLTGLSDALVAPAPRIESVLPTLVEFIGDAVIVAHNASFDTAFLRHALERSGRPPLAGTVIDTVALARRLVRDEVPNCKLGTLASRLRLEHQPSHRALDDALATTDLLHVLIERASGLGVLGLDDLVTLAKLAGHPQAAKLKLTTGLPRKPGVYMFCGARNDVLYVGKATNLRQRVRSYFGSDDRRKVGPLLRETQSVQHLELGDPLTAEIIESRLIGKLLPRYNKAGTRTDKYCYVRLDIDSAWPRLSVVKNPSSKGIHLGPLSSRRVAGTVIDALHTALPLRRCSARLGRGYSPPPGTDTCAAAQLGVTSCPCAGTADASEYAASVELAAQAILGDPTKTIERLTEKMTQLASQQRYEEAATMRDRMSALLSASRKQRLVDALRRTNRAEITLGDSTWIIERAQLIESFRGESVARALPVAPPHPPETGEVMPRESIDEALCLARFLEQRADCLTVKCSGEWLFPVRSAAAATDLLSP